MKLLPAFVVYRLMKTVRYLLLILVHIALLNACMAKPAATLPQELFPLEVGRYWKYRVTGDNQSVVENQIASSLTIGNTRWFESIEYGEKFWIRNSALGQVEAVNLYTKGENAAVFEQLDPKTLHEELMFKFPAEKGESWSTLDNVIAYEGSQTITVPAGKFACRMYSITQYGQTYSHSCIAEGVGIVYSDNILPDGKNEISELVEWGKK